MQTENGGEEERLAPVIPLFGGPVPESPAPVVRGAARRPRSLPEPDDDPAVEAAVAAVTAAAGTRDSWHPTWAADRSSIDDVADRADVDLAEKALLKKLRTRSLSVSEARGVLREFDLDPAATEHVIASMGEFGYLDDAALADQLIHAGVDRKGQGRQVIAQTLSKRGIPRDVADEALASLPDDDFERALEFARGKARSLQSLDRDTALRRLTGQLARRGYGGSVAMSAARAALEEGSTGSSGVRFR